MSLIFALVSVKTDLRMGKKKSQPGKRALFRTGNQAGSAGCVYRSCHFTHKPGGPWLCQGENTTSCPLDFHGPPWRGS